VPPGRYQLRVAAQDSDGGNVGSLQYDLDIPDFAKTPFSISGLVLTSALASQVPSAKLDEPLRGVLPGPPAALRTFPQNDEIALFAEVYDNAGAAAAHKIDITTTVTTDEGRVLFKNEETKDSADLAGKKGGFGYSTRVPLKELEPGRYVLTVSAKSRLGNGPAVERHVLITVDPPRQP
jgi:hypothetical protein